MSELSLRSDAVITALVSLATDAVPELTVVDGPAIKEPSQKELLFVGWDPTNAFHVVERREETDELSRPVALGEIACYLAVRSGSARLAVVRARAVEILTALESALEADRTGLDGACDFATIGSSIGQTHYQVPDGAQIGVEFSVEYTAYI